ncbi:MAG: 3-hydroxyacyl-CoA dehydrogenase NAD-binding domain-containing protein [Gammaproteobacteria bacterium]|jgi:3-hydroxyacyl-CoA dehydrogenase/enoyl-CoA hydratase/3-hydroxybutyryl-CoA epimerase
MSSQKKESQRQMYRHIYVERDAEGIAWLSFDQADSSANVLTAEMFIDLDAALDDIIKDPPAGLVFLSAKKSGFIAGADVNAFARIDTEVQVKELIETGQSMFYRIEALAVPTVALIHGFCLGGGLELSLACDYRIVCEDESARIGLPEVLLGIHPGFGGCVRLIRLIGVLKAMPLMLTGRSLDARRAQRMGVVDQVVPRRHIKTAAIKMINKKAALKHKGFLGRLSNIIFVRTLIAKIIRKQTAAKVSKEHYPAPFALIDLWEQKGGNDVVMMKGEADSIAKLFMHPTAKRLVRVFGLQEKLKGLGASKKSDFEPKHVHVIGAGVMGGDIAAWCALKGMRVTLQDREPQYIGPAIKRANKLFTRRLKNKYERQAAVDRLIPDHKGLGVEHADVVIEAIIENLDAKISLYKNIEPRLKENAVMATNTSSIPLEILAEQLEQPSRLIGLHFFNPVAKMQLVEVIRSDVSGEKELQNGMSFTRAIDRLPLPAKSSPGFLVNRILLPYLLEAVELLDEGVPATIIDKVALDFGMPMGPIHLADTVGLDICQSVAKILSDSLGMHMPSLLAVMLEEGRLGVKSGRGFYTYKKGKPVAEKGKNESLLSEQEVQDRMILRLLNECVACLREGIVTEAALLDAGMIFGTGFAPFRGGPIHYLEDRGISEIRQELEQHEKQYGKRFAPDPAWKDLHGYL